MNMITINGKSTIKRVHESHDWNSSKDGWNVASGMHFDESENAL